MTKHPVAQTLANAICTITQHLCPDEIEECDGYLAGCCPRCMHYVVLTRKKEWISMHALFPDKCEM